MVFFRFLTSLDLRSRRGGHFISKLNHHSTRSDMMIQSSFLFPKVCLCAAVSLTVQYSYSKCTVHTVFP